MISAKQALDTLPFDQEWLTIFAISSLLMFVMSLFFIPWLITRLPADYFMEEKRMTSKLHSKHPVVYYTLLIFKNLVGIVLIFAGILMLVLPGQGVLMILVGVGLTDFPGKFRLLVNIVRKPSVFKTLNWIRLKANQEALKNPN